MHHSMTLKLFQTADRHESGSHNQKQTLLEKSLLIFGKHGDFARVSTRIKILVSIFISSSTTFGSQEYKFTNLRKTLSFKIAMKNIRERIFLLLDGNRTLGHQ